MGHEALEYRQIYMFAGRRQPSVFDGHPYRIGGAAAEKCNLIYEVDSKKN
jgi:hypothetical protein